MAPADADFDDELNDEFDDELDDDQIDDSESESNDTQSVNLLTRSTLRLMMRSVAACG